MNCPNLSLERKGAVRVTVLTREANAEETIKKALGAEIAASKRGDLTYAIADLDKAPADETVAAIAANALKVRVIR